MLLRYYSEKASYQVFTDLGELVAEFYHHKDPAIAKKNAELFMQSAAAQAASQAEIESLREQIRDQHAANLQFVNEKINAESLLEKVLLTIKTEEYPTLSHLVAGVESKYAALVEDSKLMDYLQYETVSLIPVDIPRNGDADVGWRVQRAVQGGAAPEIIAEVHLDNPRLAIKLAIKAPESSDRTERDEQLIRHSIAEAGRCLGVAQVKDDKEAIKYWSAKLDKLVVVGTI